MSIRVVFDILIRCVEAFFEVFFDASTGATVNVVVDCDCAY